MQHHPDRHSQHADAGQHDDRRAGVEDRRLSALARRRRSARGSSPAMPCAAKRSTTARAPARRCHRVDGIGSRVGPDLSRVGQQRRAAELERALAGSRRRRAAGQPLLSRGAAGRHDRDRPAARPRHVHRADHRHRRSSCARSSRPTLREHGFAESPMPSYRGKLSPQEIADVVSYLVTLKAR